MDIIENLKPLFELIDEVTTKFINKVDSGKAKSVETYNDMKKLRQTVKKYKHWLGIK